MIPFPIPVNGITIIVEKQFINIMKKNVVQSHSLMYFFVLYYYHLQKRLDYETLIIK